MLSHSFMTHVQSKCCAFADFVAKLAFEPINFAFVVDKVVGRVGALGAQTDGICPGCASGQVRTGPLQVVVFSLGFSLVELIGSSLRTAATVVDFVLLKHLFRCALFFDHTLMQEDNMVRNITCHFHVMRYQ